MRVQAGSLMTSVANCFLILAMGYIDNVATVTSAKEATAV